MAHVSASRLLLAFCALFALLTLSNAFEIPGKYHSHKDIVKRGRSCFPDTVNCKGPLTYYFYSDDCSPATISDIVQVFQFPINTAPARCLNDPTSEELLMEQWTCSTGPVYPLLVDDSYSLKDDRTCKYNPVRSRSTLTWQCINTTSHGFPSSTITACSFRQGLPFVSIPVNSEPAPALSSNPMATCSNPKDCGSIGWVSFFNDAQCSNIAYTVPLVPHNTTAGDRVTWDVCYSASNSDPSNIIFACSANSLTIDDYSNGCSSSVPYRSDVYDTTQCILASQSGLWMQYGCQP